jgi:hypothetical protein
MCSQDDPTAKDVSIPTDSSSPQNGEKMAYVPLRPTGESRTGAVHGYVGKVEGALNDAIADADKTMIGAIARVAERAGMPMLAEHARMALEDQTPSP